MPTTHLNPPHLKPAAFSGAGHTALTTEPPSTNSANLTLSPRTPAASGGTLLISPQGDSE